LKGYRDILQISWFGFHHPGLRLHFEFHFAPPDAGRSYSSHRSKACPGSFKYDRHAKDLPAIRGSVWNQQTPARAVHPLCRKCSAWQFWCLLQPISQNGGGNSQVFDLLDNWFAVSGDYRGMDHRNTLGALAAYLKQGFDKVLMPVSIFVSNFPTFGMAVILMVVFGVGLKVPDLGWIWV